MRDSDHPPGAARLRAPMPSVAVSGRALREPALRLLDASTRRKPVRATSRRLCGHLPQWPLTLPWHRSCLPPALLAKINIPDPRSALHSHFRNIRVTQPSQYRFQAIVFRWRAWSSLVAPLATQFLSFDVPPFGSGVGLILCGPGDHRVCLCRGRGSGDGVVIFERVFRLIKGDSLLITVSLLVPYIAYLPAERLHVSGVLAAVTAGIYGGWKGPELLSASTRLN